MSRSAFIRRFSTSLLAGLSAASAAFAQTNGGAEPDFAADGAAWIAMNQIFLDPPSGTKPVSNDPKYPYNGNSNRGQPTFRIADVTNPNLKPWAAEQMKAANEAILKGGIAYTARSSCMAAGVPDFMLYVVEPVYFIQSPKEVVMVYSGNNEVRHVHMNAQHDPKARPTYYGDSVGHYEGDTLVIDTVKMNAKTYVDNYRTPHTEKLHVVERWKVVNEGKNLEVSFTVDDPDTFNEPWGGIQRYRRVQQGPLLEQPCAENTAYQANYHIPVANRPDF